MEGAGRVWDPQRFTEMTPLDLRFRVVSGGALNSLTYCRVEVGALIIANANVLRSQSGNSDLRSSGSRYARRRFILELSAFGPVHD